MIVSRNWLADYVPLDGPVEELTSKLTMAGLNLESVAAVGDDDAIDLEVTSNRPDCLGHIGIAREAAVVLGRTLSIPPAEVKEGQEHTDAATSVSIECPDLCPAYVARVIRGVKIGPSPEWLRRRLETIGVAPVNNIVDVTNYVMMECGQPLHAFDLQQLSGERIIVRRARAGENLQAIDHREYALTPEMCVIADAERPVAIGGVMGGAGSEVSERTTDVLIEVARFSPMSIRQTARALRLHSPSSYRFERKIDEQQMDWASRRCCELILQTAGGALLKGGIVAGSISEWSPAPVTLRFAQVERVIGVPVPADECVQILERLGLSLASRTTDKSAAFVPPSWRRDLTREIDLIEEIARIHGYDRIPEDRPISVVAGKCSAAERVDDRVRDILVAAGFHETVTYSFTSLATRGMFVPPTEPSPEMLTVVPAAGDYGDVLRPSLIPSLVACRGRNARDGNANAELFEIARVFLAGDPSHASGQPRRVGIVAGRSFPELRGVLEALAHGVRRAASVSVKPLESPHFVPGRGAQVLLNDTPWGWMGELDREASGVKELKLRDAVLVAEVDVGTLLDQADLTPQVQPWPQHPAVQRDLNFVLDESVEWHALESTVRAAGGPHVESVRFVEQYRGQHIPPEKKSYVISIAYRALDRTLTGVEIDASQHAVIDACGARLGAVLR